MELSWSTFVLEVINFVVLVWILKRFLYRPVLDVIARRRAGIEATLAEARKQRSEADALRGQYEGRISEWEKERQQSRAALAEELNEERGRRLAELQATLEQEREKARVADTQRQQDARRKMEATALELGGKFAGRLLQGAAGADLEERLVELLIHELGELPAERLASLRSQGSGEAILVRSAFPLADGLRVRLQEALEKAAHLQGNITFTQEPGLMAGIEVTVGAWVLGANLRDELRGFAELAAHE